MPRIREVLGRRRGISTPSGRLVLLESFVIVALSGISCGAHYTDAQLQAPRSPTPSPIDAPIRVETVASGLQHPWALAFLSDGRIVVTERPGRLRIVDRSGHLSEPLAGVPP